MKNLAKIFVAVVAGMFAFSCVQDTTEDLGVKIEGQKGGVYEVSISLEEATKTQLGEKVEGLYPLYWSEGDAIAINGVASAPLSNVAAGSDAATFTFAQPVAAPFCVVYPAPTAMTIEDEVVEEPVAPVTVYPVTFAGVQPYTVDTFASGVAPMYGYAEAVAEGEEQPAIALQHLTGVLRLAIKGNGEKVTSIKVVSEKGAIAGPHTVDCANGALTALEGASNVVNVTFAEGLVLGAEATPIYVAVPAGDYGTFLITVATEAHQKMTLKFNSSIKPINAGAVREFAEFAYEANLADSEDAEVLIDSYESLVAFAKIAPSFYPRTSAKITADIDMTGKAWTPIEYFGEYEFDGGNFEIKGLSAPLFHTTAAHIKNLKFTDVNYTITDLAKSGVAACVLHGSIDNCSVSGAIEINNTTFEGPGLGTYNDICHGALVGMAYGAAITNCVNNADVTITSLCHEAASIKCTVGGVVGAVSDGCTADNLTNNGDVIFASANLTNNIYVSGVIGKNDTSGGIDFVSISNCTNNGKVSTTATSVCGGDVMLAGITGILDCGAEVVAENLVNNGAITVGGKCAGARAAGIAAYSSSASLKNCYNTAAISVAATAQFSGTNSVCVSGLISATLTTAGIDNCYNTGVISVADGLTFTGILDVNGVINTVTGNAGEALITNVVNKAPITVGAVINETKVDEGNNQRMYVGGLFHQTTCGTFKNCYNDVTGIITVNLKKWASRLMSGGFQAYQSYSTLGVTLENCENRAALNYNPESLESAAIGGIASEYYAPATHTGLINYKNVVNKGNITVTGTVTTSGYPRLGGIIGLDNGPGMTLDGCVNEADITINTTNTPGPQIGGIMGADTNKKEVTIKNCENKGHIDIVGVMTSYIRMGGILGNKSTNTPTTITGCVNSGTLTVSGEQTKTGNAYAIGGIVGYVYTNGLTISDCTNGSATDAAKGAITLGTAPGGYGAGGILGMFGVDAGGKVVYVNDCTNYATVKQTGKGGGSGRGCLGGVVGTTVGNKDKTYDKLYVDGCKNYGDIEYGEVTCGDRISVGGVVGEPQQYTTAYITNCENHGTVAFKGKSCAKEISFGGISGMISTACEITDCVNRGTILAAGSTSSNYEAGGITGSSSSGTAKILRCANYGEVKQTAYSTGTTQFGGVIGYAYSFGLIDDCHNHGQLTIKGADAADQLSVGGVIGYARFKATEVAQISNCYNHADLTFAGRGKYYAGGVIGYDKTVESGTAVITNIVNLGNLTFSSTATTYYYGGLIGAANNGITDSKCYCDITALGKQGGNIGFLVGKDRAATATMIVKNTGAGGNFIYSEATEEDANGDNVTYGVKTPLSATTWFEYIYKSAVTQAVAEGDGCYHLAAKPTVPTAPAPAPAPEPEPAPAE